MPDFFQPGTDGTPIHDASQWRKGLVYTAKPEIPSLLLSDREYRISVAFKRKVGTNQAFTGYGKLYRRVTAIANARAAHLTGGGPPHKFVMCHGWRCLGDANDIATTSITVGLLCSQQGSTKTQGKDAPTSEALLSPGGATLEELTRFAPHRVDELWNEFDFTDPSSQSTDPVILSYGERVPACEAIDFEPFVKRAERLASFYHDLLQTFDEARMEPLKIIRREWYWVTNPNLVTIHIYFQR